MMFRRFFALLALLLPLAATVSPVLAQSAPTCQFRLGFAALHALIPTQSGACLEDENHNPKNGDGLQHTTGGLMVWRKADNWTAFTDGYHTWINGPNGLQERLNSELFPWEKAEQAQTAATTLLDLSGSGKMTTTVFSPEGNYDVAYQYNCTGSSPYFAVSATVPNNGGTDDSSNFLEAAQGQGILHFLHPGPHSLDIVSQDSCTWHVTVTG